MYIRLYSLAVNSECKRSATAKASMDQPQAVAVTAETIAAKQ